MELNTMAQDKTYVDPNYRVTRYRSALTPLEEKYGEAHDAIKGAFRKYVIDPKTVSDLATYFNDMQATSPSPISAIGSTLTEDVYPIAEDMATDPITVATAPFIAGKMATQIPQLVADVRYSDLGWKVADKVNDIRLSRYTPTYVPNYSRKGSSGNNIYLAGQDANRYKLGQDSYDMMPVAIDDNAITHEFTGGIDAINDGNHRAMTDRNVGAVTLGKSTGYPNIVIDAETGERMLGATINGKQYKIPLENLDPNSKYVVPGGSRKVNVRGLKDASNMSKEEQQRILRDRAKKLTRYNQNTSLEKQLVDMSDGYGYDYDMTPLTQHRFTGSFTGQGAVNPFDHMMTNRIVGNKSVNPWHTWIQKKIDDGTVQSVMNNLGINMPVDMLAYNRKEASQVMDALEEYLNNDYKKYMTDNKIRLRSRATN